MTKKQAASSTTHLDAIKANVATLEAIQHHQETLSAALLLVYRAARALVREPVPMRVTSLALEDDLGRAVDRFEALVQTMCREESHGHAQ